MMHDFETVVGLEVHVQLATRTKLFCRCPNRYGEAPNAHTCPVCLGLPGALPRVNEGAVRLAVRAALALGCELHLTSEFARKSYFYPDSPKGYQISQYDRPLATGGAVEFMVGEAPVRAALTRLHLEGDAGKSTHQPGGDSAVDLNRADTPLIEIVGEPVLRSGREAAEYLRALREVLLFAGVSDGNLEEGSLRCDANVSVRPRGQEALGVRSELKNLNSFRFVERAVEVEASRQAEALRRGEVLRQETRSFDPERGVTSTLRVKEDAQDYRYFPDPDLPRLTLSAALVAAERAALPRLPAELRRTLTGELGLSADAAATLTQHPAITRLFFDALALGATPLRTANFIQAEVLRDLRTHGFQAELPLSAVQLHGLLALVEQGTISGKQAKEVYGCILGTEQDPAAVVEARGMKVLADPKLLRELCEELIAEHPRQAAAVRAGNHKLLGFFIGQVMKRTEGSAEPVLVDALLRSLLEPAP